MRVFTEAQLVRLRHSLRVWRYRQPNTGPDTCIRDVALDGVVRVSLALSGSAVASLSADESAPSSATNIDDMKPVYTFPVAAEETYDGPLWVDVDALDGLLRGTKDDPKNKAVRYLHPLTGATPQDAANSVAEGLDLSQFDEAFWVRIAALPEETDRDADGDIVDLPLLQKRLKGQNVQSFLYRFPRAAFLYAAQSQALRDVVSVRMDQEAQGHTGAKDDAMERNADWAVRSDHPLGPLSGSRPRLVVAALYLLIGRDIPTLFTVFRTVGDPEQILDLKARTDGGPAGLGWNPVTGEWGHGPLRVPMWVYRLPHTEYTWRNLLVIAASFLIATVDSLDRQVARGEHPIHGVSPLSQNSFGVVKDGMPKQ